MSADRETLRALLRSRLKRDDDDACTETDDLKMLFENLSVSREDLRSLMASGAQEELGRSHLDKTALRQAFWETRLSLSTRGKDADGHQPAVAMQYILDSEKFMATNSWEQLLRELGNDFYYMDRPRYGTTGRQSSSVFDAVREYTGSRLLASMLV